MYKNCWKNTCIFLHEKNKIIHELSKVPRKWESGRALFILSILFNISEIADIMGDLTDRMRDLTGVINWRTHRWR